MKKNLYFLSFWLGLAAVLSRAVLLERLGLPLQPGNVTQVQAAGLLEGAPSVPANGAGYSLDWFTLDGGGGLISGGSYSLISTVGQPDAGTSTDGGFTLEGGFWPGTLYNAPPTVVSSVRADPDPTNAASVNFIVTFSEEVTGVGASDFSLVTTGSISGASVTDVIGSGAIYTVSVNTGVGSGTLRLDVPVTATITDLAGYPLAGLPYTSGETYTVSVLAKIYLPLTLRIAP